MIELNSILIIISCVFTILVSFYLLIRYPDISFSLFLLAGVYKADPHLRFIQDRFDLTVGFAILTLIGLIIGNIKHNLTNSIIAVPSKSILVGYFYIIFLILISSTNENITLYGLEKAIRFLTITSLAFLLPFFLFKKKDLNENLRAIARFFSVFIVLALSIVISIVKSGITPGIIKFAEAFGGDYIEAGRTIGTALIVLILYFGNSKLIPIKIIYLGVITFLFFGMFITGGRAPLIAVGISFFVVYLVRFAGFLLLYKKIAKNTLWQSIAILLILMMFLIKYSAYFSTIIYRLGLDQNPNSKAFFASAVSVRLELTDYAIRAMLKNPLGLGLGGFSQWYNRGSTGIEYLYPHNLFLDLGADGGVLGLLAILLLVTKSFLTILSNRKLLQLQHKALKDTLLGLLVFMVINATISGELNNERILFALIGLIDTTRTYHNPSQVVESS